MTDDDISTYFIATILATVGGAALGQLAGWIATLIAG